jgi:hypothetical protein
MKIFDHQSLEIKIRGKVSFYFDSMSSVTSGGKIAAIMSGTILIDGEQL